MSTKAKEAKKERDRIFKQPTGENGIYARRNSIASFDICGFIGVKLQDSDKRAIKNLIEDYLVKNNILNNGVR